MASLTGTVWDKAYLCVNYGNGHYNDGEYFNEADFVWAMREFTSKAVIDFVNGTS